MTIGEISTGHIVNLSSNDVQRFEVVLAFLHYLWISSFTLVLFTVLVFQEVGWPAFIAAVFVALLVPMQIFMAHIFGRLRYGYVVCCVSGYVHAVKHHNVLQIIQKCEF